MIHSVTSRAHWPKSRERTSVFGHVRTTCWEFCRPHGQNHVWRAKTLHNKKIRLQEVLNSARATEREKILFKIQLYLLEGRALEKDLML